MAIPDLTTAGLLPPGVHVTTLREIQARFGSSTARRIELFDKLQRFVAIAKGFGIFASIYVDGSFVTDKGEPTSLVSEPPGDIDAVLGLPVGDLAKLIAHPERGVLADRAGVKATYEIHLFFEPDPPVPPMLSMSIFFQSLKPEEAIMRRLPPDAQRGILKVLL